jgi:hypothetical protein
VFLCEAWTEIGQDPICGAQQKGGTSWKKIYNYFHEQKDLGAHPLRGLSHKKVVVDPRAMHQI